MNFDKRVIIYMAGVQILSETVTTSKNSFRVEAIMRNDPFTYQKSVSHTCIIHKQYDMT